MQDSPSPKLLDMVRQTIYQTLLDLAQIVLPDKTTLDESPGRIG
jgi:hypothetical protein